MKPIKLADYLAKSAKNMRAAPIIDLRDYGLANAAPQEDGHPIMTLRIDPKNGTLVPVT